MPEQETEWRVEEDDCGVLCLYDPTEESWETLYDTCIECGVVWGECDCDDENECKATATQEQIREACKHCPKEMDCRPNQEGVGDDNCCEMCGDKTDREEWEDDYGNGVLYCEDCYNRMTERKEKKAKEEKEDAEHSKEFPSHRRCECECCIDCGCCECENPTTI